jgi:hypothetical protein
METDPRLLSFFGVDKLPSRSSVHRFTQLMNVAYLRYVMSELVKPYTKIFHCFNENFIFLFYQRRG